MSVTREEFDRRIGTLDRCLSEFLDLFATSLDEPDRQTLKHHADDLIGVGSAMHEKLRTRKTEQCAESKHAAHCSVYLPMDSACDCGADGFRHGKPMEAR